MIQQLFGRTLTVEDVFAHSVVQSIAGRDVYTSCIEHSMLLCLTNAAKDKPGIFSVRKLVDIAMLLYDSPRQVVF